ncbi:unnamed protein product [Clonostachys rhizophaga]|uniref:Uncharacterized protein n=1 Tax=Clonostachys rhizophaga TaxID=160324 RepID=A0A9N9YUU3_9HYPO|nr:unnamed protein product [Clonostachys rhizophaga]
MWLSASNKGNLAEWSKALDCTYPSTFKYLKAMASYTITAERHCHRPHPSRYGKIETDERKHATDKNRERKKVLPPTNLFAAEDFSIIGLRSVQPFHLPAKSHKAGAGLAAMTAGAFGVYRALARLQSICVDFDGTGQSQTCKGGKEKV